MIVFGGIMKKLEFGSNEDERLNATWGEIEPYNGEYLDVVNCGEMDFLITKVVDSYKGLDGYIDVREVSQDFYKDGSYQTYANKFKNNLCKRLENYLNAEKVKPLLDKESPLEVLRDAGFPAYTSRLRQIYSNSDEYPEVVTSVRPDVFQKLADSKKVGVGMSMYHMHEEIERLQKEIDELKKGNRKGTSR